MSRTSGLRTAGEDACRTAGPATGLLVSNKEWQPCFLYEDSAAGGNQAPHALG